MFILRIAGERRGFLEVDLPFGHFLLSKIWLVSLVQVVPLCFRGYHFQARFWIVSLSWTSCVKMLRNHGSKRVRPPLRAFISRWYGQAGSSRLSKFNGQMFFATASLCFFGFMWLGELTYYPLCHILWWGGSPQLQRYSSGMHTSRILQVYLKASKADQFRVGVHIYVGRTGNTLCMVMVVLHLWWQEGRVVVCFSNLRMGPLSLAWSCGQGQGARLFPWREWTACTAYSGYSFHIGAATIAGA